MKALRSLHQLSHYLAFVCHTIYKYFISVSCMFSLQLDIQFSKGYVISPQDFSSHSLQWETLDEIPVKNRRCWKTKIVFHFVFCFESKLIIVSVYSYLRVGPQDFRWWGIRISSLLKTLLGRLRVVRSMKKTQQSQRPLGKCGAICWSPQCL